MTDTFSGSLALRARSVDGPARSQTTNDAMSEQLAAPPRRVSAPRLALTKPEAAHALGMSIDSFERHVQPELRVVRRGKLRLFALRELERWLDENGAHVLEPR